MRALFIATALFAAAPALADTPATSLTLVDAAKAPAGRTIIDGAAWRCDGAQCTATGGASQPASRACRRVVAKFGAVAAFSYRGETLDEQALATCNAA